MENFRKLFKPVKYLVIGMIHVRPLPGTPRYQHGIQHIVDVACAEAEVYKNHEIDGLLIENMHDLPYVKEQDLGPEIISCMTRICSEVKKIASDIPCGVQILAGNNKAAIAVALATGLQFIRAEGFIFGHIADEGFMEGCSGPLLRYRRDIGAENILVLTDIKKKHCSHALTADINLCDTAKAAEFFLSDGIILTGNATGHPPSQNNVAEVLQNVSLPVLLGSGVTIENVHHYDATCNMIVGSHFKKGGHWSQPLDTNRISQFMDKIKSLRI